MGFLLAAGALVTLSVIAMRFGADSRQWWSRGWLERPQSPPNHQGRMRTS